MVTSIHVSDDTKDIIESKLLNFLRELPEDYRPSVIFSERDFDGTAVWDNVSDFFVTNHYFNEVLDADAETKNNIRNALPPDSQQSALGMAFKLNSQARGAIKIRPLTDTTSFLSAATNLPADQIPESMKSIPVSDWSAFVTFHELIHLGEKSSGWEGISGEFRADREGFALYQQAYEKGVVETPPDVFLEQFVNLRTAFSINLMSKGSAHFLNMFINDPSIDLTDPDQLSMAEEEIATASRAIFSKVGETVFNDKDKYNLLSEIALSPEQYALHDDLRHSASLSDTERLEAFMKSASLTESQMDDYTSSLDELSVRAGQEALKENYPLQYRVISEMKNNGAFEGTHYADMVMSRFLETVETEFPEAFGTKNPIITPTATPQPQPVSQP